MSRVATTRTDPCERLQLLAGKAEPQTTRAIHFQQPIGGALQEIDDVQTLVMKIDQVICARLCQRSAIGDQSSIMSPADDGAASDGAKLLLSSDTRQRHKQKLFTIAIIVS